jgi:hypothetical protein
VVVAVVAVVVEIAAIETIKIKLEGSKTLRVFFNRFFSHWLFYGKNS